MRMDEVQPGGALVRRVSRITTAEFRRHQPAVLAYARLCCRTDGWADELVRAALSRALTDSRARIPGDELATRPYLYSIVRDTAVEWSGDVRAEALSEPFLVWAENSVHPASGLLVSAFRTLPAAEAQAVLWHTIVEGEPLAVVAGMMDVQPDDVPGLTLAARRRLARSYLVENAERFPPERGCARYERALLAVASAPGRRAGALLRRHVHGCEGCAAAYADLSGLDSVLRVELPVAALGWPCQVASPPETLRLPADGPASVGRWQSLSEPAGGLVPVAIRPVSAGTGTGAGGRWRKLSSAASSGSWKTVSGVFARGRGRLGTSFPSEQGRWLGVPQIVGGLVLASGGALAAAAVLMVAANPRETPSQAVLPPIAERSQPSATPPGLPVTPPPDNAEAPRSAEPSPSRTPGPTSLAPVPAQPTPGARVVASLGDLPFTAVAGGIDKVGSLDMVGGTFSPGVLVSAPSSFTVRIPPGAKWFVVAAGLAGYGDRSCRDQRYPQPGGGYPRTLVFHMVGDGSGLFTSAVSFPNGPSVATIRVAGRTTLTLQVLVDGDGHCAHGGWGEGRFLG